MEVKVYSFFTGTHTREAMKCRKSLETYNQFQSGWVQNVLIFKAAHSMSILTAKAMHSQRLSASPLRPWVAVTFDGIIVCAHCNCMAGYVRYYFQASITLYLILVTLSTISVLFVIQIIARYTHYTFYYLSN